jgi:hypothetical protein
MSLRWVESLAPLTDEACMMEALEALGTHYSVKEGRITVQVASEALRLERRHGGWILRRTEISAHAAWERQFETAYRAARDRQLARLAEARRMEEERRREEARLALVEARREAITARAREMGYTVREERRGEEIQLVLVRRTY